MRLISLLILLVSATVPATAEIRLTIGEVITNGNNTSPLDASNWKGALQSALSAAIEKATADGKCDIVEIDTSAQAIAGINTERKLQEEGYSKKTGEKLGTVIVSDVLAGVVGFDGDGGFDYVMAIDNIAANKTNVAKIEGNVRPGKLFEEAEKAAASLVEQLCKQKPYRLILKYQDLQIDALICDPNAVTTFNAKGKTAGLTFTLTPENGSTGKWTVSGKAGGVPWSGGGTYVADASGEAGTMTMNGAWSIKTPVGVFPYSGAMKGKLERFQTTHCGAAN